LDGGELVLGGVSGLAMFTSAHPGERDVAFSLRTEGGVEGSRQFDVPSSYLWPGSCGWGLLGALADGLVQC